jgi:hypothetical protein
MNQGSERQEKCPARRSRRSIFPTVATLPQLNLSLAGLTLDRILGAVRDRIHVFGRSANGVASGGSHRRANQSGGEDFLDHSQSPELGGVPEDQVALSTAFAAEFTSFAAPRTVLHAAVARDAVINTAVTIL